MNDAPSSPTVEAVPAASFSPQRVFVVLLFAGIVALATWFVPDTIAEWRARSLFANVSGIINRQGSETPYSEVKRAAGVDPSRTTKVGDGRYRLDYIYEGLHRKFTVRLMCWEYVDDPDWYLFTSELFSERKL